MYKHFYLDFCIQEKATKWKDGEEIDALTTNGVLVMHPSGNFHNGNTEPGLWLEVSVCGKLFSLRGSRSAQLKGHMVCDSILRLDIFYNKTNK